VRYGPPSPLLAHPFSSPERSAVIRSECVASVNSAVNERAWLWRALTRADTKRACLSEREEKKRKKEKGENGKRGAAALNDAAVIHRRASRDLLEILRL